MLTPKQQAFDAAVKAMANFDYPGIADLDELRATNPALVDDLVLFRDMFNAALAVEGQHTAGDAPHAPFYLDYLDSHLANGKAFSDQENSFIGITVPFFEQMRNVAAQIATADGVVAAMHLPASTDRNALRLVLFLILFGFVVGHESSHHTHGHWMRVGEQRPRTNALWRQARESEADGWSAYTGISILAVPVGTVIHQAPSAWAGCVRGPCFRLPTPAAGFTWRSN